MLHRSRLATAAAALAVALPLALIGCSKDSIDKHSVGGDVKAGLATLPKDATMVFGVDLAKARKSELWKKYATPALAEAAGDLAELKAACGLDPVEHVDRAMFSVGADPDDQKSVVALIKGSFKKDQVLTCLNEMAKKEGEGPIEASQDGKVTVYTDKAKGESLYALWTDDSTVALVPGALDDAAATKAMAEGGGADGNKDLAAMLELVDTGATLWGAGALPPQARDQLKQMGYVPDGFFLAIDVGSDVKLDFGLRYEDDKAAESSFKFFEMGLEQMKQNPPLPMLKDLLQTVSVQHTGRMVKVSAKMTTAQIEQIAGMAGAMDLPF